MSRKFLALGIKGLRTERSSEPAFSVRPLQTLPRRSITIARFYLWERHLMAAVAFGEGRLPRSSGLEAPSHKKPLCKDMFHRGHVREGRSGFHRDTPGFRAAAIKSYFYRRPAEVPPRNKIICQKYRPVYFPFRYEMVWKR